MEELWNTVYEMSVAECIGIYLLELCMFPFVMEHFYKWLYWKTKKEFFKKINWLCSPQEVDAYCAYQDDMKQKRRSKRGRD